MAWPTTTAGVPLTRVFFGGSRAGSTRRRVRTVGRCEGRNVEMSIRAMRDSRRFLRRFFTITAAALGRTGLRGRRSGSRGIVLGAELGRRATTTVGNFLRDGRGGIRLRRGGLGRGTQGFTCRLSG